MEGVRAVVVSRALGEVVGRERVQLRLHEARHPRPQHYARLVGEVERDVVRLVGAQQLPHAVAQVVGVVEGLKEDVEVALERVVHLVRVRVRGPSWG